MLKRIIIGVGTFLIITIGITFLSAYVSSNPTFIDQPIKLNTQMDTIHVGYVNWACDCANFYETKLYSKDINFKLKAEDCIFIEAANGINKILKVFFDTIYRNKDLKLIGQFYLEKGIPKSYEMKTREKPDYAKVFRYKSFEIINKLEKASR
ncbi:hypothetical protein [Maribacter forsetii]|uniref:hypothetical protein n=1 Tax=Maribacter forsetii TaxID=444515 RepID=UPI00056BCC17|nr:hypothetical protein [Maribacter forsetii]